MTEFWSLFFVSSIFHPPVVWTCSLVCPLTGMTDVWRREMFGLLQAPPHFFTCSVTTHVVVLHFDIILSLIGLLNYWAEFVECNALETEVVWLSAEILRCIFNSGQWHYLICYHCYWQHTLGIINYVVTIGSVDNRNATMLILKNGRNYCGQWNLTRHWII
jgi:hypothetical protein